MTAPVLPATSPQAIARAAAILREGGLVAMPTETVYGLAADAGNAAAVATAGQAAAALPPRLRLAALKR